MLTISITYIYFCPIINTILTAKTHRISTLIDTNTKGYKTTQDGRIYLPLASSFSSRSMRAF